MKKAALIIGLVTAQAFAIGAFAQTAKTDPLALPNKPHLNVAPGPASVSAEGTTAATAPKTTKSEKKMIKDKRAADLKAAPRAGATSPLYPEPVGAANTGSK